MTTSISLDLVIDALIMMRVLDVVCTFSLLVNRVKQITQGGPESALCSSLRCSCITPYSALGLSTISILCDNSPVIGSRSC